MRHRAIIIPGAAPHQMERIGRNIRELDRLEVWYASGQQVAPAIHDSVSMSDLDLLWTITLEGEAIGVFGCGSCDRLGRIGIPWLLGTVEMEKIKKQFMKECLSYVEAMQERYEVLVNWVWEKNKPSRRWLTWCGFERKEIRNLGAGNVPFIRYIRRAKDV